MNGLVLNMVGGGGGGIKLTGITITTPPTKTTYTQGETFDPAGMVVTAAYSNGATLACTGYSVEPNTPLADGTTKVTIRYTEGGVTKTAEQAITVIHRLTKIEITAQPTKTDYEYGDSFQSAGMTVKATYSDGATANVTGYSCSPTTLNTVGTQTITVSYTERGVTKTATTSVTVNRKTISTVPSQSGTLTYTGSSQSPTWSNYSATQLTLGGTTSGTNAGSYTAAFTPTANYRWADGTTTAKSVNWSISKAAGSLSISPTSMTLDTTTKSKTITVTRSGDGAISAVSSNTAAATVSVSGTTVTVTGIANGSATITISVAAGTNYTAPANKTCAVTVSFARIYGVEWDGTSTTKWTRTDDAALFPDPVPYVAGASNYGSPFDNLMPWSGMVKETRSGGVEVKEPKYWFKWTKTGKKLKLQIADGYVEGFSVDPVNRDRGDGLGELDYSYIGRYHCASDYKSTTGVAQKVSITRSTACSGIHNLGSNFWQMDFAQFWYVNMLFLVEFADWNGERIGRGCSTSGSKMNNGQTDAMGYHTGTTAASRDSYGFTQYRNIEGWWDNVCDWMDGCYYNSNGLNVITNPNNFSDSANGTLVGTPSSGYPSDFTIPTASGLEWALFPNTTGGSTTTYVPDIWYFYGSNPCLHHGGSYSQYRYYGPFYIGCSWTSVANDNIGCRLQERPPKAT